MSEIGRKTWKADLEQRIIQRVGHIGRMLDSGKEENGIDIEISTIQIFQGMLEILRKERGTVRVFCMTGMMLYFLESGRMMYFRMV